MHIYTYLETQQKLADLLEGAEKEGKIFIKTQDGRTFVIMAVKAAKPAKKNSLNLKLSKVMRKVFSAFVPKKLPTSPLNVPTIQADLSTAEIVAIVREGRKP